MTVCRVVVGHSPGDVRRGNRGKPASAYAANTESAQLAVFPSLPSRFLPPINPPTPSKGL
jgi:hypothetical protein